MGYKNILFIVFFLVSIAIVSAEELYVDGNGYRVVYEIVDNEINIEEEAKLTMYVQNERSSTERFRIKELSGRWDLRTVPTSIKLSGTKLLADTISDEFEVYLTPDEILNVGRYEVTISAGYENEEKSSIVVPVYIEPLTEDKKRYNPAVKIETGIPTEIDPREEVILTFTFDNLNKLEIESIDIDISSKLINEKISTKLQALEEGKIVEIRKSLDPGLAPQSDTLVVVFSIGDRVIKTTTKDYEIIDYTNKFDVDLKRKESFLRTEGTIIYVNNGNTEKSDTVLVQISQLKKLFTATYPQAKVITDPAGKSFYAWDITLGAQEASDPIIIVTSYRWLFYLIVILIVANVSYFGFRNPLIVRKQGIDMGKGELKVMINIKNPSKDTVHDLTVFDKVPNIAEVVHEFGLGTLSPSKILRSEKDGSTLLKWEIDKLEPYEDRIISYRIKPRLSIVGDFSLPGSTVKYKKKDKVVKINSNTAVIGTEDNSE